MKYLFGQKWYRWFLIGVLVANLYLAAFPPPNTSIYAHAEDVFPPLAVDWDLDANPFADPVYPEYRAEP